MYGRGNLGELLIRVEWGNLGGMGYFGLNGVF